MTIPYSFSSIVTTKLTLAADTAVKACSPAVGNHSKLGRNAVAINNPGTAAIYIGNKDVTTATGFPIAAGESVCFPVNVLSDDAIYIVAGASGNAILAEFFD